MMVPWIFFFALLSPVRCGLRFPCGQTDNLNSCIKSNLQAIIGQLSKEGAPELGINRLDPAHLPDLEFDVKRRGSGGISAPFSKAAELVATVRLLNTTAVGLSRLKLLNVRSELKRSLVKANIELMVPQVLMKGRFYINGRFGVLPIAGGGPYNITTGEVRGEWRLRGHQVQRDDGSRLVLEECKLSPRISYLHIEADNFLRSNPALSKMVVGFTNRFWPLLYEDSLPDLEQNLERFGLEILNKIFWKFPFSELFPNITTTTTTAAPTTTTPTTTLRPRSTTRTTRPTTRRPNTQRTTTQRSTTRRPRTSTLRTTTVLITPRRTTQRTTQRTTHRTTPRTTTFRTTAHSTQRRTPTPTTPTTTTSRAIRFEFFFLG